MSSHLSQPSAGPGDISGNSSVDVQRFATAGVTAWNKPTGAKIVRAFLIGGGAGGGTGSRSNAAATVTITGGGGGGPGGVSAGVFLASDLLATEVVQVGGGGAGGIALAAGSSVPGNPGSDGTPSTFGAFAGASEGKFTQAQLSRDNAGTSGGVSWANGDGGGGSYETAPGGIAGVNDNVVTTGVQNEYAGGWGADGGRSNNPTPVGPERRGGDGGPSGSLIPLVTAGGAGGPTVATSGQPGASVTSITTPGSGGGGGTASVNIANGDDGGDGGRGGRGAGGGAAGGCSNNAGKVTGTGGQGGDGAILIVTHL